MEFCPLLDGKRQRVNDNWALLEAQKLLSKIMFH